MKKLYEVELRRTSFIVMTVEAPDEDAAEALAWAQLDAHPDRADASWEVESIEEINQGEASC